MDPGEESILTKALDFESREDRAAFLDEACGDRPELRERVESLLSAYEEGGFLEQPA